MACLTEPRRRVSSASTPRNTRRIEPEFVFGTYPRRIKQQAKPRPIPEYVNGADDTSSSVEDHQDSSSTRDQLYWKFIDLGLKTAVLFKGKFLKFFYGIIQHRDEEDCILIYLENNYDDIKDESLRQDLSEELLDVLGFEPDSNAVKTILSRSKLLPNHDAPIAAVKRFVIDEFKYNEKCKTKGNPLRGTLPENIKQFDCKTAFEERTFGILGDEIESVIRTINNEISEDYQNKVLFHGTDEDSACDISLGGIAVSAGFQKRDFSDGRGFYLTTNFGKAKDWAFSITRKPAVLIFSIPKSLLENAKKLSLLEESEHTEWKKIVDANRSGNLDWQMRKRLKEYQCIEGPVSSVSDGIRKAIPYSYQLCIIDEKFADVISKYLKKTVVLLNN